MPELAPGLFAAVVVVQVAVALALVWLGIKMVRAIREQGTPITPRTLTVWLKRRFGGSPPGR